MGLLVYMAVGLWFAWSQRRVIRRLVDQAIREADGRWRGTVTAVAVLVVVVGWLPIVLGTLLARLHR